MRRLDGKAIIVVGSAKIGGRLSRHYAVGRSHHYEADLRR
jgi:hypothetical protein